MFAHVLKWTVVTLLALILVVALATVLVVRSIVKPDSDKFGKVKDEALLELDEAGNNNAPRDWKNFDGAVAPFFVRMDKGVLRDPKEGNEPPHERIVAVADLLGLSPEEVRERAIRGQNAWIVWTGGNDRFWDYMANNTFGAFDLLKLITLHAREGERASRWRHLGLVNEPCFEQATGPDENRYGLWLDRRVESADCPPDPFAMAEKYPGVRIGARGKIVPVGSVYGEPTGVVGLRLFPNPDFDEKAAKDWDPERYYNDPSYYQRNDLVRPYRVGMSCAFCHVGPSPVDPPQDPERPAWENLNSNPGAQYFWVNRIFFWNTWARDPKQPGLPAENEHNFIYQVFHTNPPGTLDTSLVSTDYINNPRTMNAVYSVAARLAPTLRWGQEQLEGDELANKQFQDYPQTRNLGVYWNEEKGEIKTARVLKDGADSVGVLGALNRVYLNIGLFSEEWILHFRPIIGGREISPIRIADAQKNSGYWQATENQTADMTIFFLVSASADYLKDAAGGEAHLPSQSAVDRGKVVFADNCAACHSSKIPKAPEQSGVDTGICSNGGNGPNYRTCWDRYWAWVQTDGFKSAMRDIVLDRDPEYVKAHGSFLENNFLSTERRVPVDLLETNACSPLASNALKGDIWDNFSSKSYKALPPVNELTVHHPVSGAAMSLRPRGAGRGYTRPASLVSLWSSAPFLVNNALGHEEYSYVGGGYGAGGDYGRADPSGASKPDYLDPYDPGVENRLAVFDESIRRMLWPESRRMDAKTSVRVPGYMYRTSAASCVKVPVGYLPDLVKDHPGFFHWLAPWAFTEHGDLELGPFPKDFPISLITNVKLLPDNDEPHGLDHYWQLGRLGLKLLPVFKQLGGACSLDELREPATQARAERIWYGDPEVVDSLLSHSKCPDFVVNRGHYFGADLSDPDKEALVAFLKTL